MCTNAVFASYESMGEIRPQHIQVPVAAAISTLVISYKPRLNEMKPTHNIGNSMPYSLRLVCQFVYVP